MNLSFQGKKVKIEKIKNQNIKKEVEVEVDPEIIRKKNIEEWCINKYFIFNI